MIVDFPTLASECAPNVGITTLKAIVLTESGGNPFAINDNTQRLARQPKNKAEAVELATALVQAGHSVDMGLAQINSKNLSWLGLTIDQVFDPCTNLQASSKVLESGYKRAVAQHGEGQQALLAAISAYNTGSLSRGFGNGYVQKVVSKSGQAIQVPSLAQGAIVNGPYGTVRVQKSNTVSIFRSKLNAWEDEKIASKMEGKKNSNVEPSKSPLKSEGF
jgi:type IV secretion system protein VirB1